MSNEYFCTCKYDAWGKFLGAYGSSGNKITNTTHIAFINPLRYRGYYYDTETGFYYLGSRYYDPQMYRFLNADSLLLFGNDLKGINLFSYCDDNPISYIDTDGHCPILMLAAKGKLDDKVYGLDSGTDVYLTKPFIH